MPDRLNRRDLTDEVWDRLRGFLPADPPRGGRRAGHRMVINKIFFRIRAGCPWRDLPEGFGNWKTACNRHRRWSGDGTWQEILDRLRAGCDEAEGRDWTLSADSTVVRAHQHAAGARRALPADRRCRPVARILSPGQHGDCPRFIPLPQAVRIARRGPGRPRTRPGAAMGGKAYSSAANRACLRKRGIKAVIPVKEDQEKHRRARGRAVQRAQHRRALFRQAQAVRRRRGPVCQARVHVPGHRRGRVDPDLAARSRPMICRTPLAAITSSPAQASRNDLSPGDRAAICSGKRGDFGLYNLCRAAEG